MSEKTIAKKFPHIDINVIKYFLNTIAQGNVSLAEDTLSSMPQDQLDMLAEQFKEQSTLNDDEKEAVKNFKSITGATTKNAEKFLRQNAWRVDEAINAFYNSGGEGSGVIFTEQDELNSLFDFYCQQDSEKEFETIQYNGIVKLCKDLGVEQTDISILVIFWKLDVKGCYKVTKFEFVDGLTDLQCKSIQALKDLIPLWKQDAFQNFSKFYDFIYDFEAKSNNLRPNVATNLWKQLFNKKWKHIDKWNQFFLKRYKKNVSKKLWCQFFDFSENVKDDFSDFGSQDKIFDPIFDDFIEHIEEN